MSIGKEIRAFRKRRGLGQIELARRANISRSYLAGVESDRYNPSLETLQRIAFALCTTPGVLLGEGPADRSELSALFDKLNDMGKAAALAAVRGICSQEQFQKRRELNAKNIIEQKDQAP